MMNDEMSAGTPGADQYQDEGAGGYCIEIYVSGGQVQRVAVERKGAEEAPEDESSSNEQSIPAADIAQALKLAHRIYEADGQLPNGQTDARSAEQQAMDGYRGNGQRRNVAGIDDVFSRS